MISVGEVLKKAREKKGLTLKQIEKELRIREKFLSALEKDDWSFFSSKVYISGLIKNYSNFVDLDPTKMQAFFRREYERKEEVGFKERVPSKYLTPETKNAARLGLILILLVFFTYFGYQLKVYITPPKVEILEPKQTSFKGEEKIHIIGKTEKEVSITIFEQKVYQDKEGVFQYDLPLKKGDNPITIEVIGANGKRTVIKKVYVRER